MKKEEYPKLPKVFKNKWIKALRSGKYKQAQGKLYDKALDGYCCLGVACRIQKITIEDLGDECFIEGFPEVPEVLHYDRDVPIKLSLLNDGTTNVKSKSFKQIANWIEHNL